MDINNMREYVRNAYPGDKWKDRVACMHKNQVIAIYHSLQSRNRDKKKSNEVATNIKEKLKQQNAGHQITIFDIFGISPKYLSDYMNYEDKISRKE